MASVIVVGKRRRREHALRDAVTVIGRDAGVDLDVGDLQVSRRHALLVQATQGTFLKDLGSRNGVLVNQQRLGARQQALLKNGDVLQLGRTTLIFKDVAGGGEDEPSQPTVVAPAVRRPPAAAAAPAPAPLDRVVGRAGVGPAARAAGPAAGAERIPRAGVYSGAAETLALRALLERSERERAGFRALAGVLAGLLVVTLLLLLGSALRGGTPEPQAASDAGAPPPRLTPPAAAAGGDPQPSLDRAWFAQEVQPVLASRCTSCHDRVGGGGGLFLASGSDPDTLEANFTAAAAFVVPGVPDRSPLVLEPLSPAEGGADHGGGAVLTADSPEWRALRDWAAGPGVAAVSGVAPTARIRGDARGAVGVEVVLSGADSEAAAGGALTYRWALLGRPAGSHAELQEAGRVEARLTPDRPGRYAVALVVHDGRAPGSAQHVVTVEGDAPLERPPAARSAAPAAPAAAGWLAAAERLLGRALDEEERRTLAASGPAARVDFLLGRQELYDRWWASELDHLGLTGVHRPQGPPWSSVPQRLRAGAVGVPDVLFALLVGRDWTSRHAGREAYVDAALTRLLGADRKRQPELWQAALRLYDGHAAEFLGQRIEDYPSAGLVRVLTRSEEAAREALRRAARRAGVEPTPVRLDEAARQIGAGGSFFRALAELACE